MKETVDKIIDKVPINEIYMELAEEAAELSQAALKMCRVTSPTNPTPKTYEDALNDLIEEYTDVVNIAEKLLKLKANETLGNRKLERWVSRIDGTSLLDKTFVIPDDSHSKQVP